MRSSGASSYNSSSSLTLAVRISAVGIWSSCGTLSAWLDPADAMGAHAGLVRVTPRTGRARLVRPTDAWRQFLARHTSVASSGAGNSRRAALVRGRRAQSRDPEQE